MCSFVVNPPSTVYQSQLAQNGSHDSSSPLVLELALTPDVAHALRSARSLHKHVHVALRRFDGAALEKYDADTGCMLGLALPQDSVVLLLVPGPAPDALPRLHVSVHRKHLPVSYCLSGAPFVLAVLFMPMDELVLSLPFMVTSKETRATRTTPTRVPKRNRAPSKLKCVVLPSTGAEARISALLLPPM